MKKVNEWFQEEVSKFLYSMNTEEQLLRYLLLFTLSLFMSFAGMCWIAGMGAFSLVSPDQSPLPTLVFVVWFSMLFSPLAMFAGIDFIRWIVKSSATKYMPPPPPPYNGPYFICSEENLNPDDVNGVANSQTYVLNYTNSAHPESGSQPISKIG